MERKVIVEQNELVIKTIWENDGKDFSMLSAGDKWKVYWTFLGCAGLVVFGLVSTFFPNVCLKTLGRSCSPSLQGFGIIFGPLFIVVGIIVLSWEIRNYRNKKWSNFMVRTNRRF